MILLGGLVGGGIADNLSDPLAPAVGAAITLVGLVGTIVAGPMATLRGRRSGAPAP